MFFSWFDCSEVDALAASLASEFVQKVPKESLEREARGIDRRLVESSDALLNRVERFSGRQRLNLFKRARLANSLKWRLQDAGYAKVLIDRLVLDVVKTISIKKTAVSQKPKKG